MDSFSCYLCGSTSYIQLAKRTRDNPAVAPLKCKKCGLVMLSSFNHIDANFYTESHMHDIKNYEEPLAEAQGEEDSLRRYAFSKDLAKNKNVLDIGCGAGGFLKKIRDIAKAVAGVEPEARLYPHFQKEDLSVWPEISAIPPEFPDVITMFHVLEHLSDPVSFLNNIAKKFIKSTHLIIEVPSASDALITLYDSDDFKKFTYWSCHLFLFTEETLKSVAERAGLQTVAIHQVQRYPLANHLYWLAHGKPGGQHIYKEFNAPDLNALYTTVLKDMKMCDTLVGVFTRK